MKPPLHASLHFYQPLDTSHPPSSFEDRPQPCKGLVITEQTELYVRLGNILAQADYHLELQPCKHGTLRTLSLAWWDLFLIDTIPSIEGSLDLCLALRRRTLAPIILLTDAYQIDRMIQAFEVGVDRVIKFPVQDEELRVRITALLRRDSWSQAHLQKKVLSVGPIRLNDDTYTVTVDDQVVPLLPLEYRLLRYLMQHANHVVSRTELWHQIWANFTTQPGNSVDVAIRRLRIKIEKNPSNPKYLVTQYGEGYILRSA